MKLKPYDVLWIVVYAACRITKMTHKTRLASHLLVKFELNVMLLGPELTWRKRI